MDAMGDIAACDPPEGRRLTDVERDALVVEVVRLHADGLLRLARRHSLCAEDAQDAYQRGLEIMLRHAHRLDPERAPSWLRTVVKHEAMAVRRTRQRDLPPGDIDFDRIEARTTPSPDERAMAFETVARSAEALHRLKPQEVRALWLRAQGNSYAEIGELTGWSRTKVNRCLYEGRRSFLERYAGIASGAECDRWQPLLSRLVDGEATREELVELRPHLRACTACRARRARAAPRERAAGDRPAARGHGGGACGAGARGPPVREGLRHRDRPGSASARPRRSSARRSRWTRCRRRPAS